MIGGPKEEIFELLETFYHIDCQIGYQFVGKAYPYLADVGIYVIVRTIETNHYLFYHVQFVFK